MKWEIAIQYNENEEDLINGTIQNHGMKVEKLDNKQILLDKETENIQEFKELKIYVVEKLEMLNAVMQMKENNFEHIEYLGICRFDKEGNRTIFAEGITIQAKARMHAEAKIFDKYGIEKTAEYDDPYAELFQLSLKDARARDFLHYRGMNAWADLYKAYEIIADSVGGIKKLKKKCWVHEKDLSSFSNTAQSRKEIGDAARHASSEKANVSNPIDFEKQKR